MILLYNLTSRIRISSLMYIIILVLLLTLSACQERKNDVPTLKVDMSAEHDEGRFLPEKGDKISIAGNFNNWKKDTLFLQDEDGDWIYEIELEKLVKASSIPLDTLTFKLIQSAGDSRQVANQGWETIENRNIPLNDLYKKKISLVFNEDYDGRETAEVTFTVGMSNQMVLGFFVPEEGDKVIVSGSFCNWSGEGMLMEDKGNNVYSFKIPIKYEPEEPIEFKFKILTKRRVFLLNNGWETTPNRKLIISENETEAPYIEFSDMRRVARFVVNTENLEKNASFNPRRGDILQIKLNLDEKETLTDPLVKVGKHTYETAIIIPMKNNSLKYSVIKNLNLSLLSPVNEFDVPLTGKVINVDL